MNAPGLAAVALDLVWWAGRTEHWLRFGAPIDEVRHDRRRRTLIFAPGAVFAVVRWSGGDHGTVGSELDIIRAPAPGDPYTTRPGVRPGGELLGAFSGWTRVQRALGAIDDVEALGIAAEDAALAYWRHVHSRLQAGLTPRPYDDRRHRAWLLRRRCAS